jgi:thiol-disulfide isomerase/thioredoxin
MAPGAQTKQASLLAVTESTFGQRVINSPVPVVALFGAPSCAASRAMRPQLHELALVHAGTIRFVTINAERAALLAGQFGLHATPTLIVVQHGEIATRAVGFVSPRLLQLLCDQVASGTLPPEAFWNPVEATFEDLVIVPMLDAWGITYVRQAACPRPARTRIDFLVYDEPAAPALTLFENKRQIVSDQALAQAAAQAHGYARALGLPSCVVAAPAGLWIYASMGRQPALVQRISSLELLKRPNQALAILRQIRYAASDNQR